MANCSIDASSKATDRRLPLFVAALAVATFVPMAAAPAAFATFVGDQDVFLVYSVIAFLGAGAHVASTGWFFTNGEMRAHFAGNRIRYVVAPLALVAAGGLLFFLLDPGLANNLIMAFFVWQVWHYQRQNFGILSFLTAGTDRISVRPFERRMLNAAAVSGILGWLAVFAPVIPSVLSPYADLAYATGRLIWAALIAALAVCLLVDRTLRANPLRMASFGIGVLFFSPLYIFDREIWSVMGFALAHGLQYLVFMAVVSGADAVRRRAVLSFIVIAAAGGFLLDWGNAARGEYGGALGNAIFGAYLGLVCAHFVYDAGIWKLRERFQRDWMRRRFAFIFSR